MHQTYELTAKIHQLLPQINQKYGLEIKVESDFCYYIPNILPREEPDGFIVNKDNTVVFTNKKRYDEYGILRTRAFADSEKAIPSIQAPQLRQILVGLQEVLGENPGYTRLSFNILTDRHELLNLAVKDEDDEEYRVDLQSQIDYRKGKISLTPKSQAEALYQKWCCGWPKSMLQTEPETVLQELVEILENLLK